MEPVGPEQTAPPEEAPRNIWDAGTDAVDTFNVDYLAEQAVDPDDPGYLFGTAMSRD